MADFVKRRVAQALQCLRCMTDKSPNKTSHIIISIIFALFIFGASVAVGLYVVIATWAPVEFNTLSLVALLPAAGAYFWARHMLRVRDKKTATRLHAHA